MVLGMLFENFKNYYILRYVIYEFLKKVLGVPQPTCLVRVFCALHPPLSSWQQCGSHRCMLPAPCNALHPMHRAQCTLLCTASHAPSTAHSALYCALHPMHRAQRTLLCTASHAPSTAHFNVHCIPCTEHSALYCALHPMHQAQRTAHFTVHCIPCTEHSALYCALHPMHREQRTLLCTASHAPSTAHFNGHCIPCSRHLVQSSWLHPAVSLAVSVYFLVNRPCITISSIPFLFSLAWCS